MLRYKASQRKGPWADSPSNPDRRKKRYDRKNPKVAKKVNTLEGVLRRMIVEEVGDAEITKEQNFALLQKFGLAAPRIDRKVNKPLWLGEKEWNRALNEFYKATKNLVPAVQQKSSRPTGRGVIRRLNYPNRTSRPRVSEGYAGSISR